jgi:hypothetical protein
VETKPTLPDLNFPVFPDPLDAAGEPLVTLAAGRVSMPLSYWLRITEYVISVEAVRQTWEAWREVYGRE